MPECPFFPSLAHYDQAVEAISQAAKAVYDLGPGEDLDQIHAALLAQAGAVAAAKKEAEAEQVWAYKACCD